MNFMKCNTFANANGVSICRRVTPGSQIIINHLRKCGLIDIYEQAGFTVGAPGCSFCLAIAADVAKEGEVWLSSQNRNYRNRMGKGSIANLASAVTVAASSFNMEMTDPSEYLKLIDQERFHSMLPKEEKVSFNISEPAPDMPVQGGECVDHSSELSTFDDVIEGRAQVYINI